MGGRKGSGGVSRVTGGRVSRTGGNEFQKEKTNAVNEIVKDYEHIIGRREVERDLKKFIQEAGSKNDVRIDEIDGKIKISKEALERAERLADKIVERAEFVDRDIDKLYRELKPRDGDVYYFDMQDRSDVSPDNFREYQQRSRFRINSDPNRLSINELYTDLYNDGANPYGLSGTRHPAAQLVELNNTLANLQNSRTYGITSERARHEVFGGMTESQIRAEIRDTIIENTALATYYYRSGNRRRR